MTAKSSRYLSFIRLLFLHFENGIQPFCAAQTFQTKRKRAGKKRINRRRKRFIIFNALVLQSINYPRSLIALLLLSQWAKQTIATPPRQPPLYWLWLCDAVFCCWIWKTEVRDIDPYEVARARRISSHALKIYISKLHRFAVFFSLFGFSFFFSVLLQFTYIILIRFLVSLELSAFFVWLWVRLDVDRNGNGRGRNGMFIPIWNLENTFWSFVNF